MNNIDLQKQFNNELESFISEFEIVLSDEMNTRKEDPAFFWKEIRDQIIRKYHTVNVCYMAHGMEHDQPYDQQSATAKLGRKTAGSMLGIVAKLTDRHNMEITNKRIPLATTAPPSAKTKEQTYMETLSKYTILTQDNREKARFVARGPVITIPIKEKTSTYTSAMVYALKDVGKGQMTYFVYNTEEEARHDQQLMAHSSKAAGWNKGLSNGDRPYKTTLKQVEDKWHLQIFHLEKPHKI